MGLWPLLPYLRNVRGFRWNHKRVYHIYRELELNLRIKLSMQYVAVIRVACKAASTDHQALAVCDGNAHLHAKLIGLAGLALALAFDFGCVQGVEFVFVFRALAMHTLGTLHHCVQAFEGFVPCGSGHCDW